MSVSKSSLSRVQTAGICDRAKLAYLEVMGINVWVRRSLHLSSHLKRPVKQSQSHSTRAIVPPANAEHGVELDVSQLDWDGLRQRVAYCRLCELHKMRTQTVFGVGDHRAEWLFIGEAPGADEDRLGEPFVGRAGQLLNNMLTAIGLSRQKVFIANILKCRPPKNRDPLPEESQACRPYLQRQIELINPKIIVALGRIAAQNLLQCTIPLSKLRGRQHRYEDTLIPVVVTYHPAYLLRSPREKRKVWADLQFALELVRSS